MDFTPRGIDADAVRRLVACLREMDRTQQSTDMSGGAEIAWYYTRSEIEDILGLPRGSLDNPPAEEEEEEPPSDGKAGTDTPSAPSAIVDEEPAAECSPGWAAPPGEILREWMLEQRHTVGTLAEHAGIAEEVLIRLLSGSERLTRDLAKTLAVGTGISEDFWIASERTYRADLDRVARTADPGR